jgi:hypothetical protein
MVTWLLDDQPIQQPSVATGFATKLRVEAGPASEVRRYRCELRNPLGQVRQSISRGKFEKNTKIKLEINISHKIYLKNRRNKIETKFDYNPNFLIFVHDNFILSK